MVIPVISPSQGYRRLRASLPALHTEATSATSGNPRARCSGAGLAARPETLQAKPCESLFFKAIRGPAPDCGKSIGSDPLF
ncbi:hypothetical protein [Stappia sp. MMSF_3263]|uniref:hypothetical protein n=1 Tax=Stappia sp. MMSF_3263 TaxID=3046693 RepID=UPI00273FB5AA|nr:hypothetical protein [Stappia sp. MMSF_3263]